jgi:dienelactone hydrolase
MIFVTRCRGGHSKMKSSLVFLFALSLVACSSQAEIARTEVAPAPTQAMSAASNLPTSTIIPSLTPAALKPVLSATHPASPTPTSQVNTELVSFTTQDGITLSGTLFGEGDFTVILAHMGMPGTDQVSWHPFARLLAEQGFRVLTFDFRGRGESAGQLEFNKLPYDMDAAIQYLVEHGYSRIICVGASMGGTACMRAALDHELLGLGVIASVLSNGIPNEVSIEEVKLLKLPKILVYGAYDFPTVTMDMKKITELAAEPKIIQVYQTYAHGTDIFNTEYGGQFSELLVSFLEDLRTTTLIR